MRDEREEKKVFFNPGDEVVLNKKNIHNVPVMWVSRKINGPGIGDSKQVLIGIECKWFDDNKTLQKGMFSTKDLKHYKSS